MTDAEQLALEVVERRVERRLRRLLALDGSEPGADLLEREGIVTDEVAVLGDEREGGLRGLGVALDRSCLAAPDLTVVIDRHMDDVRPVRRLATDDERLRQLETDDLGAHLHG